jgi:hypothetical protein
MVQHAVGRLSIKVARVELRSQRAQAKVFLLRERRPVDHGLVHNGASSYCRVLRRENSVPRHNGSLSCTLRRSQRSHMLDELLLRLFNLSLDLRPAHCHLEREGLMKENGRLPLEQEGLVVIYILRQFNVQEIIFNARTPCESALFRCLLWR